MKKIWTFVIISLICIVLVACSNQQNAHKEDKYTKDGKVKLIIYGDFKCPYCKKVDTKILPKLNQQYIKQGKVDYQFVNMAFLGKDAIIGSRAGHAVQLYAPQQYFKFQQSMFAQQPNNEKQWITTTKVDQQIDKLSLDTATKEKIKKDYKTQDSKSWKAAKKDQQRYKKNKIKTAPTVFIGGTKVEDPYKYSNYKHLIDKKLKKDK
ncbi:thioredoxin domain-containing protein [Staphylococcus kloosii]|uniref:DsbA family protein n=1 Tax=Staphylococcus kloosii TaxID=29384 RepID=UPI0028A4CA1C|nr:thioredoxin domain-containing protein [Staphylococcus kloosii]MDT3960172.1 thioredoxin domain-containing protein [Staphylococcus kloosii]